MLEAKGLWIVPADDPEEGDCLVYRDEAILFPVVHTEVTIYGLDESGPVVFYGVSGVLPNGLRVIAVDGDLPEEGDYLIRVVVNPFHDGDPHLVEDIVAYCVPFQCNDPDCLCKECSCFAIEGS